MDYSKIDESNLWKVLEKQVINKTLPPQALSNVKNLTDYAAEILGRINETFPNYTWHNPRHALNVVGLMDSLLGDFVDSLTPLECSILLVSAFMHDVGMAFTPQEREALFEHNDFSKFHDFTKFLEEKPEMHLRFRQGKKNAKTETLREVASDYCRWKHAERVDVQLQSLEEQRRDWLLWSSGPLRKCIRLVCESHNWDMKRLLSLDSEGNLVLHRSYRSEADLLFCAIILRLADILDFDRTRTPEPLYRYLGLSPDNNPISDMEWKKHMASGPFSFPEGERRGRYEITFTAHPKQPEVEYAIRHFLDDIEREIEQCRKLLENCSPKRQNFPLPGRIDRQIESQDYKSGVYRFVVDEKRVIDLLMGENLYENPYVFVRELIQNAIDTTRHRLVHEEIDREIGPVTISYWPDKDGNRWVRVDDDGMGMNESIIQNYFLRIGRSYYLSSEFQLDVLDTQEKEAVNLTPISRFGIGILSCFIRGDRIEISTQRRGEQGLRLSLPGLDAFHVLYSEAEGHVPKEPMPRQGSPENGYRHKPGTSVAVRLSWRSDHTTFDLEKMLKEYVLFSKVPVEYQGRLVGGNYQDLILKPWIGRTEVELNEEEMRTIETILHYKFSQPLRFVIQPLDLTAASVRKKELAGQAIISYIEMSEKDRGEIWSDDDLWRDLYIDWSVSEGTLQPPSLRLNYNHPGLRERLSQQLDDLKKEEKNIRQDAIKMDEQGAAFGFVHKLEDITFDIFNTRNYFSSNRPEESDWLVSHLLRMQKRYDISYIPTPKEIREEVQELSSRRKKYKQKERFDKVILQEFSDWLLAIHPRLQAQFKIAVNDSREADDWDPFEALLDRFSKVYGLRVRHAYQEWFEEARRLLSRALENLELQESNRNGTSDTQVRDDITIDRMVTEILPDRAKRILAEMHFSSRQNYGNWLSHNGIRIPVVFQRQEVPTLTSPSIFEDDMQWVAVALFDSLRPQLNVARDKLVELSWPIYSNLLLTFAHALQNTPIPREHCHLDILPFSGSQEFILEDFDQDEHMMGSGEWARQSVLLTDGGRRSVEEVRHLIRAGESVRLALWQNSRRRGGAYGSPLGACRRAIIQKMLSVEVDVQNQWLTVVSSEQPLYFSGLRLFPPFTFLPYRDSTLLKSADLPFNTEHRFSKWFLGNVDHLKEKYPALFSNLTTSLFATVRSSEHSAYDSVEPHHYVQTLQQALNNIRDALTESDIPAPPSIAYDDFYFE